MLVAAAVSCVCGVLLVAGEDIVLVFSCESGSMYANIYVCLSEHTWIRTQRVVVPGTGARQHVAPSPCGRYVLHIDENEEQATSSVIDLRCATFSGGVVVSRVAIAKEVAPRGVGWSTAGVWLRTQRGALLLEE